MSSLRSTPIRKQSDYARTFEFIIRGAKASDAAMNMVCMYDGYGLPLRSGKYKADAIKVLEEMRSVIDGLVTELKDMPRPPVPSYRDGAHAATDTIEVESDADTEAAVREARRQFAAELRAIDAGD